LAVTDGVRHVPSHAPQNDFLLKLGPLKVAPPIAPLPHHLVEEHSRKLLRRKLATDPLFFRLMFKDGTATNLNGSLLFRFGAHGVSLERIEFFDLYGCSAKMRASAAGLTICVSLRECFENEIDKKEGC
jgi:hypothetical protein